MLCGNVVVDEPEDPVIEGIVNISGEKRTALFVPQPLPNGWGWSDDANMVEHYDMILNDLGNGEIHLPAPLF